MSAWTATPRVKRAIQGSMPGTTVRLAPALFRMLRAELAANRGVEALLCRSSFAFNGRLFVADHDLPSGVLMTAGRTADLFADLTAIERRAYEQTENG